MYDKDEDNVFRFFIIYISEKEKGNAQEYQLCKRMQYADPVWKINKTLPSQ